MDSNGPGQTAGAPAVESSGASGPAKPASSARVRLMLGTAVVVLLVLTAGLLLYTVVAGQTGKVIFSTDLPQSGVHSGCTINHQVTSVGHDTSVYATYMFNPAPRDEIISLAITRDGQTFVEATPIPAEYTHGIACFSDMADLSRLRGWGPGAYHFAATTDGTVVAADDLVVTSAP
jgi:hypothetical protein